MPQNARMARSWSNLWIACFVGLATSALGQSSDSSHEFGLMGGESVHVFGSSETLSTLGLFYRSLRHEPRLGGRRVSADLVFEGYAEQNFHAADTLDKAYSQTAVGGLAMGRWNYGQFFVDFGAGLQVQSRKTHDLSTYINSTPVLDLGWRQHAGSNDVVYGVRYLHISNANTDRPNRGQNQLLLYVALKF